MTLRLYVAAVTAAAVAVGAGVAALVPSPPEAAGPFVLLMGALVLLAEVLQVRHHVGRDQIGALNLMEGILAPLVFFNSGTAAVLTCVVALLIADRLRSNDWLKVTFNAAQWTVAAGLASLLVHLVRAETGAPTLLWVCLGILTMSVVNQAAVTTVLALASGGRGADRDRERHERMLRAFLGRLVSNIAGLATGVCLTSLYLWDHWLLLLGAAFVVGLDTAGRANAALQSDHARLEGMQRASHALATSMDPAHALPLFLAETRIGFEVQKVQLVLFGDRATTVHTCTGTVRTGYEVATAAHPLASLVAPQLSGAIHLHRADGSPAAALVAASGHERVLAAPLRVGPSVIGVLFLYDRLGIEGFERGELKVADALARELVGFLDRVQLLQAVDEERRKLADILGNTSDGIFSIESDGTITSWNAGLAAMTGYAAEEMVGTRHFGLLRPRDAAGRDVMLEHWLEVVEGNAGSLPPELQIVAGNGQTVWLSCSYSRVPASDNGRDLLVVVARNTTQARELERLKDDFVAVVSHELRTPLVPIKGWAQTLLNRGERLTDDQRRTAVQSILAQAQKLESLVLNILEASRIEAGRTDFDGITDVAAVTAHVVEETIASRPDRVVRLRPPSVPCVVEGSAVWVERAVANLVANAVKYSPDDEPVDVLLTAEADTVLVSVTDRGPGIAPEAQGRIFDRFERLEETRKQTGTGLGLYITRRLARAMGGDVTVSSVPGAGSTFLLRLPLARVTSSAVGRAEDDGAAGSAQAGAPVPAQRGGRSQADNVVHLR